MDRVIFPEKPGFYERVLRSAGTRYALSIPDGYDRGKKSPLVLVLHWGGTVQPYRGSVVLSGLALPALEQLDAIMAAPDCPDRDWDTTRSESMLLDLLAEVESAYSVDHQRRVITGYSMGGMGAWSMGAVHQEWFSAVIPISATPPEGMLQVTWRTPLYVIHSRDDEHFSFNATQRIVRELKENGAPIDFNIVEGVTHFDVGGFIEPLSQAVPWVRQVWSQA